MAVAETARLISSLELQDKGFSRNADMAIGKVDKLEGRFGRLGKIAGDGLRTAGRRVALLGAGLATAGAALTARAIRTGLDELAELEDAITSVDGAIQQVGLTGRVTGQQIAAWANEIESNVQAAFDDKEITAATTNLIRYGNLAPGSLRQAMEVMTDLAAKNGDVGTAGKALAKSLADPTKATRLLRDAGVNLSEQESKTIKRLVESGKVHQAQAMLLDLVAKKTEGAARDMHGPYRDAILLLNDAFEDGRKALAEGFMPLIQRFAGEATEFFGKQSTIDAIRNFGQWLADAAESGLEMAKRIPWGTIGDGLKMAADWAGKLFGVFQSIPPEVQTTLIALAGLDRLSGGAISGIVSELGKGLIKGVLGITAGVVNLRAATVTGAGGGVVPAGGKAGTASRIGGALSTVGKVFIAGIAAGVAVELAQALGQQSTEIRKQGQGVLASAEQNAGRMSDAELAAAIANIDKNVTNNLGNQIALAITNPFNHAADNLQKTYDLLKAEQTRREESRSASQRAVEFREEERRSEAQTKAVREVKAEQAKAVIALATSERTTSTGLQDTSRAAQVAGIVGAAATAVGSGRIVSAVNAIPDPSLTANTTVIVNVAPGTIQKVSTTETSYGRTNGSSGGGRDDGGRDARRRGFN